MRPHYIPLHTLRRVCQLAGMPEARAQIPVAIGQPDQREGGLIVMLERETD